MKMLKLAGFLLILTITIQYSISFAQAKEDCLMCHDDPEFTTEIDGKEISLNVSEKKFNASVHNKLNCVACHTGYDPEEIPHKEEITPINCLNCHKKSKQKHLFHPQILNAVGTETIEGTSCFKCHGNHYIKSIKSEDSKWNEKNLIGSCASCHKVEGEKYSHSQHASGILNGIKSSPNCITCHKNAITTSAVVYDTLELKIAREKLCLSCHLDDPEVRNRTAPSAKFISSYENSVHGKALRNGNKNVASCIDCHTAHEVSKGTNSISSVNKINISKTCGKCHIDIAKEYEQSVHGKLIAKGFSDAPTCTNCHGEHNILRHDDPKSPVAFQNLSAQICSECHGSLRLSEKYEIASNRFSTFQDSYHGLALRGGSAAVANCASCHGVHNIKNSSDPTSKVNSKNLIETCGSCHPGADANFTKGKIHVTLEEAEDPILYWISYIYITLIVSIVGGMFVHNLLDLIKKSSIKKQKQAGKIREEKHGNALYLRMTVLERLQHITMAVSFILLVITGFMLRFPDTWWVSHIRDISQEGFEYRSVIHRISAVVMIAVSLYHIYYISFTQRGRQLVKDLWPKFKDITDAIGIAKYNLGISKDKPLLDRFSYVEKAEYWALVWGTVVMSLTGLLMWIYTDAVGSFTKLQWDIARTIHYFEAWLAFLAIVVWHFYFVIFNPNVYPMNLAWIKGTITEEEMADEHALELERIKESEEAKEEGDNT
jgi:cytochrome b subunit of formate dehydrogenase